MALVLICSLSVSEAFAAGSVQFVDDRINQDFSPCFTPAPMLRIEVRNTSDTERTFDLISTSPPSSWYVSQLEGNSPKKSKIIIGPGETLTATLGLFAVPPTYTSLPDTFMVSGIDGIDTLTITWKPTGDTLAIDGVLDFGTLSVGDSARRTLKLTNLGSLPYPLSMLGGRGVNVSGFSTADYLPGGATLQFEVLFTATEAGRYDISVEASSFCSRQILYGRSRVIAPNAYWTTNWIDDTKRGCGEGLPAKTFELQIRNDKAQISTIDSIGYRQYKKNGWTFDESAWKGVTIVLGRSKPFLLTRNEGAGSTELIIYANGWRADVLDVRAAKRVASPRIRGLGDTTRYSKKIGDTLRHRVTLENLGDEPYTVKRIEVSDPSLWSIVDVDTFVPVTKNDTRSFFLRFKGGSTSGDYPVTVSVQGEPCDTILKHTVSVSIASLAVADQPLPTSLKVYPLPTSSFLHVEAPMGSEIKLLDLLGNEVLSTTAYSSTSDLDIRKLNSGSYILVVDNFGRLASRRVTIER